MIKHIVIFKLKDQAEGCTKEENAVKIKSILDSLPGKIEQIRDYEVGIDINKSERAFDIALYSSFDSLEDLQIYAKHPAHLEVVDFIMKVRIEGKVVDYEV